MESIPVAAGRSTLEMPLAGVLFCALATRARVIQVS
jgi:hypothetical protein